MGNGRAIRYGIGVGRDGFRWSGVQQITKKAEWPDWTPPAEMIARQPYLPRFMAGGPTNPLGARAMYLGNTIYRIHGTNAPSTIGQRVSSGCIRLTNEDVTDLASRVNVGTKVIVINSRQPRRSPDDVCAGQPAPDALTRDPEKWEPFSAKRSRQIRVRPKGLTRSRFAMAATPARFSGPAFKFLGGHDLRCPSSSSRADAA